ncbi:MAG: putative bifunctional tRNA threonylcarbamoyladenosine biosynthesis protein [Methanomicrobiales archaeon 53_19]|uniref:bifunctional N(6)-L-threonylcarbamoyladenine synthase/serine/threonine protein kinase n=1 Tax=Methanocalculus sp. TaxID=2004547 RepID=UPI0007475F79|nr:bifunctional N(6)-L-threonylcarbamoyladenine synthase/serine/threonine protein kinase [Methanocalculus sp.]KUK69075.1 MAG: putative bifunctional tRNA threonylcarbamoyladenosine biosynthesis protein [Methanocalculus sp. 52_23]KUL05026.1 MAG: putative bifunctional tRNA threonylcarbamoyladenosine biosynthesis protein [Methanomicrobiales archaeon 53_19]HIJ05968.1 bifunctional N(6)-L-threonylcarbamoyladenine synthase/serine/threonine protein kinase [Methanocalculus sp.]
MPRVGQVLGIEGTAWNLSAAVFDDDLVSMSSSAYTPPQGGIHPREAARHHASVLKDVIAAALADADEITGVAFSQGPGLGPCLRTVGTAARSLALRLGVPLIGVNHCVAHIEIGRFATGYDDPIVLYASGANTQVLGYLNGRYRIFGETLDIGIGNALDKFARYHNLPHPGGPIVEELAKKGSYIPLPYTVKGMDLAFSGLVSAAKDSPAPLSDVCFSLQETAFAMCVEVTERALAHTGKDEAILVGGVGVNSRLQEMLTVMCEERGASFAVPGRKYMGDNGAMIAYTGRIMLESGQMISVPASGVNPSFRSDQVEVTWRHETGSIFDRKETDQILRGAEAEVNLSGSVARKHRLKKGYRHPVLDAELIRERTRAEARIIASARRAGVPTPVIMDLTEDTIVMEGIEGETLKYALDHASAEKAGAMIGRLHSAGIAHGDLTTSNMIKRGDQIVLIDFGLSQITSGIEARGVDLHVIFQTLESTREDAEELKEAFVKGYRSTFSGADDVLVREHEIELRGRYL